MKKHLFKLKLVDDRYTWCRHKLTIKNFFEQIFLSLMWIKKYIKICVNLNFIVKKKTIVKISVQVKVRTFSFHQAIKIWLRRHIKIQHQLTPVIWYSGINKTSFVHKINYIGYKRNCLLSKINTINEKLTRNKETFIVFIWNIIKS